MKKHKLLGVISIVTGTVGMLIIAFNWLFVDYFSSPGLKSSLGVFLLFSLLVLAGVLMLQRKAIAKHLYNLFFGGLLIERSLVFFFFKDYILFFEIYAPLLIGTFIFILSTDKKMYKDFAR